MLVYNLRNKYFIIFLEQCQQLRKFLTNDYASMYLAVNYTYVLCPEIPLGILSENGRKGTYLACIGIAVLNDGFVGSMNPYPCIYVFIPEG